MLVKETKVKRSGREYVYLQLVDGYRDESGRVKPRVVANLGRKDALKDSGQLEAEPAADDQPDLRVHLLDPRVR